MYARSFFFFLCRLVERAHVGLACNCLLRTRWRGLSPPRTMVDWVGVGVPGGVGIRAVVMLAWRRVAVVSCQYFLGQVVNKPPSHMNPYWELRRGKKTKRPAHEATRLLPWNTRMHDRVCVPTAWGGADFLVTRTCLDLPRCVPGVRCLLINFGCPGFFLVYRCWVLVGCYSVFGFRCVG